jgi:t-SNARE complex subunit (syntaxin)
VRTDEAQDIEKSIDSLAKNITEKAKLVKSNLANLKEKIVPLEKILYERNVQRFKYIMDNYFVEMGKFRKILRNKACRSLKIIDPKLTDEQIEVAIEENQVQKIIEENLISEKLDRTVKDIEERHAQIIKLTQTIEEAEQLFTDLALLVDIQQEQLDVIEHRISIAKEHTQTAEKSLNKAENYQQKSRKRTCLIVALIMVVLTVIIAPSISLSKL